LCADELAIYTFEEDMPTKKTKKRKDKKEKEDS
jgi:hypothetical protein